MAHHDRECCITVSCHVTMRNTVANIVNATHDGTIGCYIQHVMTGPEGNCEFCSQAYFCQT